MLDTRPMALAGVFILQHTGSHSAEFLVPLKNCIVHRWFFVALGPKPL
jgi:hypothetical protein